MLKLIKSLFGRKPIIDSIAVDHAGRPVGQDVLEAVVRLLIEITRSDSDIADEEAGAIMDVVMTYFAESEEQIPALLRRVADQTKQGENLNEVFALLNQTYSPDQRLLLLSVCWRIVMADGEIARSERRFATQLRYRFQLSEEQERVARELAEG
jgi:uncharacterized tellurite resistance protein B-like protein